ncbi:MAG: DUF6659 family protein [Candidatus Nitrosocaldaceae archaeon]
MLDTVVEYDKTRYEELCKRIFDLNDKIRFTGVLNENGKLIAGGMRGGVKPLEDEIHEKRWFHQTAIRREMTSMFEKIYGKVRYILADREKIKQLTFYMDGKILLISLEPDLPSTKVVEIAENIYKSIF